MSDHVFTSETVTEYVYDDEGRLHKEIVTVTERSGEPPVTGEENGKAEEPADNPYVPWKSPGGLQPPYQPWYPQPFNPAFPAVTYNTDGDSLVQKYLGDAFADGSVALVGHFENADAYPHAVVDGEGNVTALVGFYL